MIYPRTGKRGAPQAFAKKLRQIVDEEPDEVIAWGHAGIGFTINNMQQFVNDVLVRYFKHDKFSSFQRQLNLYGFKKVHKGPGAGGYANPLFTRDHPELMEQIVRAKQHSKRDKMRQAKKVEEGEAPSTPQTNTAFRPSQRKAPSNLPQHAASQGFPEGERQRRRLPSSKHRAGRGRGSGRRGGKQQQQQQHQQQQQQQQHSSSAVLVSVHERAGRCISSLSCPSELAILQQQQSEQSRFDPHAGALSAFFGGRMRTSSDELTSSLSPSFSGDAAQQHQHGDLVIPLSPPSSLRKSLGQQHQHHQQQPSSPNTDPNFYSSHLSGDPAVNRSGSNDRGDEGTSCPFFSIEWLLNPNMSLEGDKQQPVDEVEREVQKSEKNKHNQGTHEVILKKQNINNNNNNNNVNARSLVSSFNRLVNDPFVQQQQQQQPYTKQVYYTISGTTQQQQQQQQTLLLPHQKRQVEHHLTSSDETSGSEDEGETSQQGNQSQTQGFMAQSDSESDEESGSEGEEEVFQFDDELASTFRLLDITPPSSPSGRRQREGRMASPLPLTEDLDMDMGMEEMFALLA